MRRRQDDGSVLLLTLGLSIILLMLVAVVVDVSSVVLAKRALSSAADGAAVAAAQQPDRTAIARSETALATALPLDAAEVASVVAAYEIDASRGQAGLDLRVRLEGAAGSVAVVDAYRTVRLPFAGWLRLARVQLHATGRARSPTTP